MKVEVKTVTPEIAKGLLLMNKSNRRLEEKRIVRYSEDIKNGKWRTETGEAIKLSKDGSILDGQHRLHAIIKANIPIDILFIEGLDSNVMPVLDTGKPRSAADVLVINGVKNATKIASLIQGLHHYERMGDLGSKSSIGYNLTNEGVLNYYRDNENFIDEIMLLSGRFYKNFQQVLEFLDVSLFLTLFKRKHGDKGVEFMRQLCQGTDVKHECIIFLRNKLIANRMNNKSKMLPATKRALIIKTFNAYLVNSSSRIIRYLPETEEFPKIK